MYALFKTYYSWWEGGGRKRTTRNKKKRVRFPCQTTSDIREQAQGTLLSPHHSLSFLLPERYWRSKLNRPWELEQGEALGTLNLVGWLCGTLSLSRQLQQLPMLSEQPFHPRDRQGMSRSPVTLPRSSEQTLHCEHVLQPRGCRTQTHPEGMLSQPVVKQAWDKH